VAGGGANSVAVRPFIGPCRIAQCLTRGGTGAKPTKFDPSRPESLAQVSVDREGPAKMRDAEISPC
jgi:hypothetical protein